eukprot:1145782-Pelagomonas_calceolata.AAC.1
MLSLPRHAPEDGATGDDFQEFRSFVVAQVSKSWLLLDVIACGWTHSNWPVCMRLIKASCTKVALLSKASLHRHQQAAMPCCSPLRVVGRPYAACKLSTRDETAKPTCCCPTARCPAELQECRECMPLKCPEHVFLLLQGHWLSRRNTDVGARGSVACVCLCCSIHRNETQATWARGPACTCLILVINASDPAKHNSKMLVQLTTCAGIARCSLSLAVTASQGLYG